jgi:5'-3' exoribonuclease 2
MEGDSRAERKRELLERFKWEGAWSQEVQEYATREDFDSNLITPGTTFLSNICKQLRLYIKGRLETHRHWKQLVVVFSDANCPGEGEHKIMEFIRQERASSAYAANQSHCIYGADADLIMLSLATHEPKFYIIREVVITANDKFCSNCQKRGHFFMDCGGANSIEDEARVTR